MARNTNATNPDREKKRQEFNAERDENLAKIAEAMVTILDNRFTPDSLFNAMFQEIVEMSNTQGGLFTDPAVLRIWLPKAMRKMICS